jgi:hypothetical protein
VFSTGVDAVLNMCTIHMTTLKMLLITIVRAARFAVASGLMCCLYLVPLMLSAALTLVTPASALLSLLYCMYQQCETV